MLQKVEIHDGGESTFLVGEQVDRDEFEEVNNKEIAEGGRPAVARPVLQGITQASPQTRSLISAAAFPQTTRVLPEAATNRKEDRLFGHQETLIVGRHMPERKRTWSGKSADGGVEHASA